jgi:hypothetical protein
VTPENKIEDIPMTQYFKNVFPSEIPGLLPIRDIEFFVDLQPGTGLISISPYRMATKELQELKEQLEDLLDNGLIRQSVSLPGAPILLVTKKDRCS